MTRTKLTKSRDGVMRFTIRVAIRIGRQDAINILIGRYLKGGALPESRAAAVQMIRDECHNYGFFGDTDKAAMATEETKIDIARCIDDLFPEFLP